MRQRSKKRRAKARQASKLAEIRAALIAGGFDTAAKQAAVLGLGRSTAWAFLNRDESTGATAKVFKRILSSPNLPLAVRRKIEEYVKEKSSGLYGHSERQSEAFRDKLRTPDWRQRRLKRLPKLSGARPRTVTCLCWLLCANVNAMSALGQKRTCAVQLAHVRFAPIADIPTEISCAAVQERRPSPAPGLP